MADLVVIVPSRGRPQAVAEMAEAFDKTCTANTELRFAVDEDDPTLGDYSMNAREVVFGWSWRRTSVQVIPDSKSMVQALNTAALEASQCSRAVAFQGDDHRPRTKGWDTAYLEALEALPGLVYGNDLIQGANLPTQVAMSSEVVRALGHMAPPPLTHLYVDNYWRDLGRASGCIAYLSDVVVEHVHPVAGKASWDEGYRRVNDEAMYEKDAAAYAAYWAEHGERDVQAVRRAAVLT